MVDFLSVTFGGDFLSGWMGVVVVCGLPETRYGKRKR